ncbi:MAG: hypothetical protein JWQ20_414 [Conexibacter sp.]|nr:hypothetical protein [Conexibacter sp.]
MGRSYKGSLSRPVSVGKLKRGDLPAGICRARGVLVSRSIHRLAEILNLRSDVLPALGATSSGPRPASSSKSFDHNVVLLQVATMRQSHFASRHTNGSAGNGNVATGAPAEDQWLHVCSRGVSLGGHEVTYDDLAARIRVTYQLVAELITTNFSAASET